MQQYNKKLNWINKCLLNTCNTPVSRYILVCDGGNLGLKILIPFVEFRSLNIYWILKRHDIDNLYDIFPHKNNIPC